MTQLNSQTYAIILFKIFNIYKLKRYISDVKLTL